MDPMYIGKLMLMNIAGIIVSVIVSSRLVLLMKPMRLIWISGFLLLLVFHVWMSFLFSTQADVPDFIIPLFVQGAGVGMLMAPIIFFMVSSVPTHLGDSASATGVFFRLLGFTGSIALTNYFQLYQKTVHYNRFHDQLTSINTMAGERMNGYKQSMINSGVPADQAGKMAGGHLGRFVDTQAQMRFSMDYYHLMCWLILIVILFIALAPYISKTIVNVRTNQPAPAPY
jgi:hypothetical protein